MILAEVEKNVYNIPMFSSRKSSIIGAIVAAVCIIVYIGAIVNAVIRIYTGMEQRLLEADYEFSYLFDKVTSTSVLLSFNDEEFKESILKVLSESRTLEGVIITSSLGEFAFEKEQGKAITWVNGMPRFKKRFEFSRQDFSRPLQIQGLRNVNLQAVAGAFDYPALTGVLKQTLILIAAALAMAFFTLLIESLINKHKTAGLNDGGRQDKGASKEVKPEKPSPVPGDAYSQRGRVIKEELTENRLTEELLRSAKTGYDLSFIAVEFKPPADDYFYARFAADAARFFSSRDFVCEKGEKGISIICPGLNLDACFLNAGEFHSRIMGKYPEVFKANTDLCMGLSARSGRPVNAERLIFEADEALERAMMDPVSHIVAFKSDPEKYQAFMENRGSEEE
jgi:hypothetical protein